MFPAREMAEAERLRETRASDSNAATLPNQFMQAKALGRVFYKTLPAK
jgi:hypothetical protein